MADTRRESDALGEVEVPAGVHYGAQTARAVENFPVSGLRFPPRFIRALGLIKAAAADVNRDFGLLAPEPAGAIRKAAMEVAEGKWDAEFVLDVFQTGSGTSTNMNANEVVSSRANEILGGKRGDRSPVRPNDEVNLCQSSNDVIPTALHLASLEAVTHDLLPPMAALSTGLDRKAAEFRGVLKTGRTHLQDAVPVTLGQEFEGWATQVRNSVSRIKAAAEGLKEVPLGGTAVGTGLNAHPDFGRQACAWLAQASGMPLKPASSRFEATGARDAVVHLSGALRGAAVSLAKVASDIRLLSCGPRTGLGEITVPALQPGSSIMPGKVNPVMPEMMLQVCARVAGNDATVAMAGMGGQLELNAMVPVMAFCVLESIAILGSACRLFNEKCVSGGPALPGDPDNARGIRADRERCRQLVERSLMAVTALVPRIGYKEAAAVAQEAHRTGKTVREIVLKRGLVPEAELDRLLDLSSMTEPGIRGTRSEG
jgi:fumarate hydratase class II